MRRILVSVLIAATLTALSFGKNKGELANAHRDFVRSCTTGNAADVPTVTLKKVEQHWQKSTPVKLASCSDCSEWVNAWRGPTGFVVELGENAESGDWQRFTTYCIDARGKTTSALSEFVSFRGWVALHEYHRNGRKLELSRARFIDLDKDEEISEPTDWSDYRSYEGNVPSYTKLEQMPFAGFLK